MNEDINVMALIKGKKAGRRETYVFIFAKSRRADVLRKFGEFASNYDLSFTWHDAAMLSQRVRAEVAADNNETHLPNNRLK